MKVAQRRFIIRLAIISIIIYVILRLIAIHHPSISSMPDAMMVAVLFAVNSLAFMIVTNSKTESPSGFVYPYITVTFGRLILCAAYVFIYALLHKQSAKVFVITFFILYFLYTIAEIRAVFSFFKQSE